MQKSYWIAGILIAALVGGVIGYYVAPHRVVTEEPPEVEFLTYEAYGPGLEMPRSSYSDTLKVYSWAGYEEEGFWNDGTYAFETLYPNVDVSWSFYGEFGEALTKMMADPTFADVIMIDTTHVPAWGPDGADVIGPLDPHLIPLFGAEFYPILMSLKGIWLDGELMMMPFEFGYHLVIYRDDILDDLGIPAEDRNDYNMLFQSYGGALEGKILYYDDPKQSLYSAIYAAGIPVEDMWHMSDAQYDAVKAKFLEGKANVKGYWLGFEEGYSALITGEAPIVTGWGDTYYLAKMGLDGEWGTEDDVDVKILTPPAPTMKYTGWVDCWAIRKDLEQENPELYKVAHAFINANIDREACKNKIDMWAYGTPNKYAAALADPVVVGLFNLEDPEKAWDRVIPCEPTLDITEKWYDLWLELKAG